MRYFVIGEFTRGLRACTRLSRKREEAGREKAMRVGVESCISMPACMNFSYSPTILKAARLLINP